MARPRGFDETEILRKIMWMFWENGYGATSLEEIEKATGVLKPSLYRVFGNKESLFLKAHDLYEREIMRPLVEEMISIDGVRGVRAFFDGLLSRLTDAGSPSSCLCVKVGSESPKEGPIRDRVQISISSLERCFHKVLHRAQQSGEIHCDLDVKAFASLLVATAFGLGALGDVSGDDDRLKAAKAAFETLLSFAETPPTVVA